MLIKNYNIELINPASYNPRYLSESKKKKLIGSIKEVGFLKPIIINSNNTIIAGHQRSKCLLALGVKVVPAFVIDGISKTDEVRFNQMHNGSDIEIGAGDVVKINTDKVGWHYVEPNQIEIISLGRQGNQKKELSRLFFKYGEFGSCVIDSENNCIISSDYASVSKMMNKKLYVYKESCSKKCVVIKEKFSDTYGEFNYDQLSKQTYIQCLAQMNRLAGNKQFKSTLYEKVIIPKITKKQRILDFGAGKMAYVKKLESLGYNIIGVEFYLRILGKNSIDVNKVNSLISIMIKDIEKNGLFDVVICDSVLNSVDSMQAHKAVINTLRSLCKKNGAIYFSGRRYEFTEKIQSSTKTSDKANYIQFYDKNLFTANFRGGNWFYQKMHTEKMVKEICLPISSDFKYINSGSSWQVVVSNENSLTKKEQYEAIDFEFNLPLPNNKSYGKHEEVKKAISKW
tara:strand:- start:1516 stop:2880 length:1365 start_codon:yes stop_codon:yes gene_type:complete